MFTGLELGRIPNLRQIGGLEPKLEDFKFIMDRLRAGDRVDFSIWKAFAPFGGMSYLSVFFGGGLSPPEVVPNGKTKFTHKKLRIWTNIPAWGELQR